MRQFFLFCCTIVLCAAASSQTSDTLQLLKKKKHQIYATWGYTRAWYSKSTIHFKNTDQHWNSYRERPDNYDFTIYNATAHDRPDFDKIKDVINMTIPQFVMRLGFMFNDKWGVELNYDHAKYVVDDYQKVRIKGQIDGHPINGDTIMEPNHFLHFEHTDGANFWMANLVRKWELYKPSKKFIVSAVLKPGGGVVYPRTDVTIFGQELNNAWHVAGWIVGVEGGLRIEYLKRGFFEFVGKGCYADYMRCFILGSANGNANHHFWVAQTTATLGFKFGTK